jgi:phosphoesterase RecJ-like protein
MREDADRIKVSCRSQGDFSVSDICARYFGGGGHQNAAGGEFSGTVEEAVALFHQVLADLFPPKSESETSQQPTEN